MEQESSSKDEQSDDEESEDEGGEKTNIAETRAFNIMLGCTYTRPFISKVTLEDEKDEPILNFDDGGRFKVVQYSRKNDKNPSTSSEGSKKKEPPPKQSLPKERPPKEPSKKDPPKKDTIKKDPPKGEPKAKAKDKDIELDIDAGDAIGKMTMRVPIKAIVKLPSQQWCVK